MAKLRVEIARFEALAKVVDLAEERFKRELEAWFKELDDPAQNDNHRG